jgi:alanyl-tRNA synthetase
MKAMQKQLDEVAAMRDKADAAKLIAGLQEVNGVNVVCGKTNAGSMDELREVADMTSSKLDTPSVVVLACANDGKVNLVVKATKEANAKGIHAGKIIKEAAAVVGGGGGGRPDMAQAGGKNAEALPQAFDKAVEVIKAQLG